MTPRRHMRELLLPLRKVSSSVEPGSISVRPREVVIDVLIDGGHDFASVLEGEEGGEAHH